MTFVVHGIRQLLTADRLSEHLSGLFRHVHIGHGFEWDPMMPLALSTLAEQLPSFVRVYDNPSVRVTEAKRIQVAIAEQGEVSRVENPAVARQFEIRGPLILKLRG